MFKLVNEGIMLKIIKKITITIFLVIPVIGSGVSFAKDAKGDKVVATYMMNGKKTITESEIISYYQKIVNLMEEERNQSQRRSFSDLSAEEKQAFIKQYLVAKLIDQEVEKKDILKSKKLLESLKIHKKELIRSELLHQKIIITNQMVNDQYKKIVDAFQGQEEVKTAHILVSDKDQAIQIKRKLSKGAKFSDLAKEFSKDESTKYKGGEIADYINLHNVSSKEYGDKAFSMKKNDVSDPIEINNGWYIIKVLDRRAIVIPIKEQIEQSIRTHLFINAVYEYGKKLLNQVNLDIKI